MMNEHANTETDLEVTMIDESAMDFSYEFIRSIEHGYLDPVFACRMVAAYVTEDEIRQFCKDELEWEELEFGPLGGGCSPYTDRLMQLIQCANADLQDIVPGLVDLAGDDRMKNVCRDDRVWHLIGLQDDPVW